MYDPWRRQGCEILLSFVPQLATGILPPTLASSPG
jgi:hypothetical protein